MGRTAVHPGEHLAELLEAFGPIAIELIRPLQVPGSRISQIVTGHRAIASDTALRLGHSFGTSPQFWLTLQATYDLRVAEEQAGATISELPTLKGRRKRIADVHAPAVFGSVRPPRSNLSVWLHPRLMPTRNSETAGMRET